MGERIKDYLDCFNKALLEVNIRTLEVVCLCLIVGLLEGDFRRHLTSKDIKSMKEIHQITLEYMQDEDVSRVVSIKRKNLAPSSNKAGSSGQSSTSKTSTPRVGKFSTYTPLVASLTKVYQQVSHKSILSRARQIRPRASLNKSQYCDYHESYGYRTEDCIDLKDTLEQAIQDGKLPEFVQHVKLSRRQNDNEDRD
ncbi:uncharacterized protein LOC107613307 [Arachis ipaensis]|uniref:uncharacterized protein LOC107613307 n=1 Tax=Arachis ipaensis TaxID=130454 RepID=UPI0007AFDAAA|nr:uncharacterized protein LOC107613307 [Arachis ipaensis]